MRQCNYCKQQKDLKEFHPKRGECKPCRQLKRPKKPRKKPRLNINQPTKSLYAKEYMAIRRKNDANFKLRHYCGVRLRNALKQNQKIGSTLKILGCDINTLKEHLESKFKLGMTWDNWNRYGWHIDHIIPLASFDLTNPEELAKACHYSNLQPLWAKENLTKSKKFI